MDLLGDNFCDCKETQVCGVRFPPPKFHSCDYVRARNALIPQAVKIAGAKVSDQCYAKWTKVFASTMDKLTRSAGLLDGEVKKVCS